MKEAEIGDIPTKAPAEEAKSESVEDCSIPDFPVHVDTGDYNGDGIQDEARILISTSRRRLIGIFAFMKSKGPNVRVIQIKTLAETHPKSFRGNGSGG